MPRRRRGWALGAGRPGGRWALPGRGPCPARRCGRAAGWAGKDAGGGLRGGVGVAAAGRPGRTPGIPEPVGAAGRARAEPGQRLAAELAVAAPSGWRRWRLAGELPLPYEGPMSDAALAVSQDGTGEGRGARVIRVGLLQPAPGGVAVASSMPPFLGSTRQSSLLRPDRRPAPDRHRQDCRRSATLVAPSGFPPRPPPNASPGSRLSPGWPALLARRMARLLFRQY